MYFYTCLRYSYVSIALWLHFGMLPCHYCGAHLRLSVSPDTQIMRVAQSIHTLITDCVLFPLRSRRLHGILSALISTNILKEKPGIFYWWYIHTRMHPCLLKKVQLLFTLSYCYMLYYHHSSWWSACLSESTCTLKQPICFYDSETCFCQQKDKASIETHTQGTGQHCLSTLVIMFTT